MTRQHVFDSIADEVATWLDTTADALAGALIGRGPAPFAAPASEREKAEFYRAQLFNPDGSPNTRGRDKLMTRLGPEGFAEVMAEVMKREGGPAVYGNRPGFWAPGPDPDPSPSEED